MTNKTVKIISIVLMVIPSLMIAFSAFMKLSGAPQMMEGLGKAGFTPLLIKLMGALEVVLLALFFYPKTYKVGFLLLCCYLGGALSIEISHGQPPMSAILLTLIWVSVYLRNKSVFLDFSSAQAIKG